LLILIDMNEITIKVLIFFNESNWIESNRIELNQIESNRIKYSKIIILILFSIQIIFPQIIPSHSTPPSHNSTIPKAWHILYFRFSILYSPFFILYSYNDYFSTPIYT
jgi:hypothetical protein